MEIIELLIEPTFFKEELGLGFIWDGNYKALEQLLFELKLSGCRKLALTKNLLEQNDLVNFLVQNEFGVLFFELKTDLKGLKVIEIFDDSKQESKIGIINTSNDLKIKPKYQQYLISYQQRITEKELEKFDYHLNHWAFQNSKGKIGHKYVIYPHQQIKISEAPIINHWKICNNFIGTDCVEASIVIPIKPSRSGWTNLQTALNEILSRIEGFKKECIIIYNDEYPDPDPKIVESLSDLLIQHKLNYKLIYMQTQCGVFSAGLARNLGVFLSSGEIVACLDGDTIPSPEWFKDVVNRHKTRGQMSFSIRWEGEFSHEKKLLISKKGMEPYWVEFNENAERCLNRKDGWKYFCSHSVSLNKNDWLQLGGFAWVFQSYGYEDTEFAYRATKNNIILKVAEGHSIHIDHRTSPQTIIERHKSLKKTARQFFWTYPNEEIAHHVFYLFGRNKFKKWLSELCLRVLSIIQ